MDQKYEFEVCFGENASQKDTSSGSTTSIGTFDRVSRNEDNGQTILYFHEGTHCWNHGPRVAEVRVSCGRRDVLKAVSEPSTCVYYLDMESPQACTPQWERINDL